MYIFEPLPGPRHFPGLGPRWILGIENLDTGTENKIGPLNSKEQVMTHIDRYHNAAKGTSFNVYVSGQYVGGTEV